MAPVVTTSSMRMTQRPASGRGSQAACRRGPGSQPECAVDVRSAGRSIEVELGDRGARPFENRGERKPELASRRARDQLRLVIAARPRPVGMDGNGDEQVAAGTRPTPAPRDRRPERDRQPLLTGVLQLVQRVPDQPRERRAPFELEQWRRNVGRKPDGDAGRHLQPGVERGQARGADRRALRPAARAAGGQREVQHPRPERGKTAHRRILAGPD